MSFSKTPEVMRMKARRSRWRLSMFAWILKTKPVKVESTGSSSKSSPFAFAWRGAGGGASSMTARRNGSTPKLFTALP